MEMKAIRRSESRRIAMEMQAIRRSESPSYDDEEDTSAEKNSNEGSGTGNRKWKIVSTLAFFIAAGLLAAVIVLAGKSTRCACPSVSYPSVFTLVKSTVEVPSTGKQPTPTASKIYYRRWLANERETHNLL